MSSCAPRARRARALTAMLTLLAIAVAPGCGEQAKVREASARTMKQMADRGAPMPNAPPMAKHAQGGDSRRRLRSCRRQSRSTAPIRPPLDVLDRRRHRLLQQRPPLPQGRSTAAQGRRPYRGTRELLPLRRSRTPRVSRSRSGPRSAPVRGTPNIGLSASGCERPRFLPSVRRRATSSSSSTRPARWPRRIACPSSSEAWRC